MKPITLLRTGLVGCAVASVLRFIQVSVSGSPAPFDDAYMFLRYAKHFLSGQGFSWNASDGPAYGPTSALYLIATTIVRSVTSITDASVLLALPTAAGLLACAVLVFLGFLILRDGPVRRSWLPLAIVPLLVLSSLFQYHSRTGMETMLSLLCNAFLAVSVVAFTRSRTRARFALCLLAGYLSYLARPDNGVTALLVPPLFFAASDRRLRTVGAVYVVLVAAVIVADLFVKAWLFGDAVPLSFLSKHTGFYPGYLGAYRWNAARYTLEFMAECLPWLALIVAFADTTTAPQVAALLAPVAITFGFYLSVTQIMGWGARYYFPFLPFVMLAAFAAIRPGQKWAERLAALRETWGRRAILIATLLLVTASPSRDFAARAWRVYVVGQPVAFIAKQGYVTPMVSPLPYVAGWENIRNITALLAQVPPDSVVAASEYGYLGSTLPQLTIVDVLGLNDRRIAHEGFSAKYLFSRHPDIIWFPHQDYSFMIAEMIDSPLFADRYEYFPAAFELGVALNTQSPRFASIKPAVERAFARVYEGRQLADYQARALRSTGEQASALRR